MQSNVNLVLRYLVLIILGLLFPLLYYILTPLTVYPVYGLLSIFYEITLYEQNTLFVQGNLISLIPACIAASAYYLLLILNLSSPMKVKTRTKSLIFIILTFLVLNIIRIFVFSILIANDYSNLDTAHQVTWYLGSTIMLVIIWITNIFIFKIKSIPVYSDLRYLYSLSRN